MLHVTTDEAGAGWAADDSTFGARLALVRQRMGWGNVSEAALACGFAAGSWRNWERDGRIPRDQVAIARRISDRTECSYRWLLEGPQKNGLLRPDSNREPAGYIDGMILKEAA